MCTKTSLPPLKNCTNSPLIVLMKQIGVNQLMSMDCEPTSAPRLGLSEQIVELPMSNTSVKVALVFLVVLASPTASFARGGGGGGGRGGGSAAMGGSRPNAGAQIGTQQML